MVVINDDRFNFRMSFHQFLHVILWGRKSFGTDDNHQHYLPRASGNADVCMSQHTSAGILIVRFNLKWLCEGAHGSENIIGFDMLDEAHLWIDQTVAVFLIQTGMDLIVFVTVKRGIDLVSVMIRIFHTLHFIHFDLSEELLNIFMFIQKCLFIFLIDICASAAFFINGTVFHSFTSLRECTTFSHFSLSTS